VAGKDVYIYKYSLGLPTRASKTLPWSHKSQTPDSSLDWTKYMQIS
jgi:hypothetical protein